MSDTPEPAAGPRQKIREYEVVVSRVVVETPDTVTLYFEPADGSHRAWEYKAGQFLTIRPQQLRPLDSIVRFLEALKGKREPGRAYSMASSPHEADLGITIKEERYEHGAMKYPPLLSPFLVFGCPVGTRMTVSGFGGPYVYPADIETRTDHIVHVCAGSGIVPNMSLIRFALGTGMKLRHTLVYGNKTWDDIIFRDALAGLASTYSSKLSIVHAISREPSACDRGDNVRLGRVTETLLRELIPDPSAAQVFTCGPGITPFDRQAAREKGVAPTPRFLESTLAALEAVGVPKKQVHYESYG